jgi:hypothetical protein
MIVALVTTLGLAHTMAVTMVENYGIYRGLSRDYPPGRSDHEERMSDPCQSPTGLMEVQARAHKSDSPIRETDHRSSANQVRPYLCRFGQR